MKTKKRVSDPFANKLRDSEKITTLKISSSLDDNEAAINQLFANCSDLVVRRLYMLGSIPGMVVYLDVLVDDQIWDDGFLEPLMQPDAVSYWNPAISRG